MRITTITNDETLEIMRRANGDDLFPRRARYFRLILKGNLAFDADLHVLKPITKTRDATIWMWRNEREFAKYTAAAFIQLASAWPVITPLPNIQPFCTTNVHTSLIVR
ncbi:hypothetical protein GWI33_006608 [Rhynchophorus ferrugineus]|uniref:Uncharacterized protein n=1 Tax=Rhynchophorus ferrugineus TaxID=354439 RepID=A0A834IHC1_RHYFE|nr:hypothetical protein GWI33_006608 [Rhynchophorus ferrugineus]